MIFNKLDVIIQDVGEDLFKMSSWIHFDMLSA